MPSVVKLSLGVIAAALTTFASAATVNFSGALSATDPTFNRPLMGSPPTGLSGVGNAVSYDVFSFTVTAADLFTLQTLSATLAAPALSPDDTFIGLYQTAFNPLTPLVNVLATDDDSGTGALSLLNYNLSTGVQYYLVVTSFTNGAYGAYTGSISNAGAGTAVLGAVPEPSTAAMLLGALVFGAGVAARRRNVG